MAPESATNNKLLILGAAVGYSAEQLKPFVISLKETDYQGDVVFLISRSDTDAESIATLQSWGIKLEPFESWRLIPACLHFTRYIKYFEYITEYKYDYILLTDTIDVIFQKNPFYIDGTNDLYFFAEDSSVRIGTCVDNSKWIKSGFGSHKVVSLHDKVISCSGVTMGSYYGIMKYLMKMIEIASRVDTESLRVAGIDQAFHNVLIHDQLIEGFRFMANQKHVNTMGHLAKDGARLADDGTVVNSDGTISNIVHQYNYPRHKAVHAAILKRYS